MRAVPLSLDRRECGLGPTAVLRRPRHCAGAGVARFSQQDCDSTDDTQSFQADLFELAARLVGQKVRLTATVKPHLGLLQCCQPFVNHRINLPEEGL